MDAALISGPQFGPARAQVLHSRAHASSCSRLLHCQSGLGPDREAPCSWKHFRRRNLRHWNLPCEQYNGLTGQANRAAIVADLVSNRGLQVSAAFEAMMQADADALDAVVSCYAARAVVQDRLGVPLPPYEAWQLEGSIAVHA